MAFLGSKAVLALHLVAMVMAASVGPSTQEESQCFCDCMKTQCMNIEGATKEGCARACSDGCTDPGFPGQSNPGDYCGY